MTAAKAWAAAALGFLAPGAAYLIGVQDGGYTGNEWITAGLIAIASGGTLGGVVYAVENKPKV